MFKARTTGQFREADGMAAKNEEFQEIGHAGGMLEIQFEPETTAEPAGISTKFSHSGPGGCSIIQMAASLDGKVLEFVPIRGMRTMPPPERSPIVSTFLISDRERMFGRTCPKCCGYFRTDHPSERSICPYCGHTGRNAEFTTKNQRTFIDRICRTYEEAWKSQKSVQLNLDKLTDALPENRPSWGYNEERQQNLYTCRDKACRTRFDVLGEYACCPSCGQRNSMQVLEGHLAEIQERVAKAPADVVDWEQLTHCFSDFEAMAKDIQSQLVLFPTTPRRRSEIESLSFQRLAKARESLLAWFAIELFAGLSPGDVAFLLQMLQRRHVFVHNGGRVDQDYLDATKDTSVRLHQQLEVRRSEIERLVPHLRRCGGNLFSCFESIK